MERTTITDLLLPEGKLIKQAVLQNETKGLLVIALIISRIIWKSIKSPIGLKIEKSHSTKGLIDRNPIGSPITTSMCQMLEDTSTKRIKGQYRARALSTFHSKKLVYNNKIMSLNGSKMSNSSKWAALTPIKARIQCYVVSSPIKEKIL